MKQASEATSGTTGDPGGSDPDVVAALREIDARLAGLTADLAPERVPGHRLAEVIRSLTAIERKVRGARLVLRKAAADTGDWKAKGHRSPADQVAKEEGISHGQATREIEASGRLTDMDHTRDAVARGEISPEAAAVVAEGTAADPSAESALVRSAKRGDLRATRRRAQEAIARADERSGERARRIYQRRSLRTWVTVDGEGHGHWNIPTEMHARVMAALQPYRDAAFRAARAAGEHLTDEQLMADALDMLMRDVLLDDATHPPSPDAPDDGEGDGGEAPTTPPGPPSPGPTGPTLFDDEGPTTPHKSRPGDPPERPRVVPTMGPRPTTPAPRSRRAPAQVHVLVDFDALRRGFATTGETCEIHGIGPVPAALAAHLLQDSLLRLIVTGTDITKVTSQRRYIPEAVRRALFARDKGRCVACGSDRYLELHHHTGLAQGGPTEYANLAHLCSREHALVTHCGWTLHRTDTGWEMHPPSGPGDGRDPP